MLKNNSIINGPRRYTRHRRQTELQRTESELTLTMSQLEHQVHTASQDGQDSTSENPIADAGQPRTSGNAAEISELRVDIIEMTE